MQAMIVYTVIYKPQQSGKLNLQEEIHLKTIPFQVHLTVLFIYPLFSSPPQIGLCHCALTIFEFDKNVND